jgi:replicative DNA helicase
MTTTTYDARQSQDCLIGAILHDANCLDEVSGVIQAEDFSDDACRTIFRVTQALHEAGKPIDLALVGEELLRRKQLDNVGGAAHLYDLFSSVATAGNASYYARQVKDASLLRQLAWAGEKITCNARDQSDSPEALLEEAEQTIFAIGERAVAGEAVPLHEALVETMQRVNDRSTKDEDQVAVPSGLQALDDLTCGFHPGELIVVAARPSLGKTAVAVAIAANVARGHQLPVFFASLEQSRHEICERLLAAESEVSGLLIRSGRITQKHADKLTAARDLLSDAPIYIDDAGTQTVGRIAAVARRLKRRQGVRLVIVDYLQLITPEDRRAPRHEQVASISRRLKQLARDLQLPVIALAQLNRESEGRQDKRPRLADLRESGSIEADADTVLLLHRPDESGTSDRLDIIIGKQRNGPTGEISVRFVKELMRVEDLTAAALNAFAG